MNLGEFKIDDYLPIAATTHRFSSGAAYAATSITYRIYEEGSVDQIVEDQAMTNFDSETGLYYDRLQLTAALGFEAGKTYLVLIKATVDSIAAIDWRIFRVKANTDIPTTAEIADKILGRNQAGGSDGGRMVKDSLRFLRNKKVLDPNAKTLTIYLEDDTTIAWVEDILTNADAEPIISADPRT